MRHAFLFLTILAACATNSPDPADDDVPDDGTPTPTPTPTLTIARTEATEIELEWTGADHVWIVYAPGEAPAQCAPGASLIDTTGRAAPISGLAPHTAYGFRLCPVIDGANGTVVGSGVTAQATTLAAAPGDPQMLALTENHETGMLHVTWNAASSAASYLVAYAEGSSAPATCFGGTTTTQHAIDLGPLSPNRTFAIRVCAVNDNPTPETSGGATATIFLHSPLAHDPSRLTKLASDAQWLKVGWSSDAPAFRVSYDTQPVAAGCPGGVLTSLPSAVLETLAPKTTYYVRVCAQNGDSQPLVSDGIQTVIQTPDRPVIHVTGLRCTDEGQAKFWGQGDPTRYYRTLISQQAASSAPLCAFTNQGMSQLQIDQSLYDSSWSSHNLGAWTDQLYWVRVCYLKPDGTFDQGQQISMTSASVNSGTYIPARCSPASLREEPYVSINPTSSIRTDGSLRTVSIGGYCRAGTTVHVDGDVVHVETACSDTELWGVTATIATTAESGELKIVATDWWDTDAESAPAVQSLSL